jgi:two-component system, LuxR family, sensor kinase FixL
MATGALRIQRGNILLAVAALIALIALADWRINAEVPVGFLYLLPIVLASRVLSRAQVAAVGVLCALLAELFDGVPWTLQSGLTRDVLYLAAFAGVGLFAHEVGESRRVAVAHVVQLERENQARKSAEEQLQILVESSPIAIFTADANGQVLLANDAAHRLFELPSGSMLGESIHPWLPSLSNLPDLRTGQQSFRTVMQCKGHRRDGDIFMADVWFSTYRTPLGPRLAAMVVDASDELRDREEASLHQLLAGSRILVSAVSHEIRNICGAIALVHANLSRSGTLSHSRDFEALGSLIKALERIAAMELRQTGDQASAVDLHSFFDELKIVNGPSFREKQIAVEWDIPSQLPPVWADPHSLMQVFLNLIKNSERALIGRQQCRIRIAVAVEAQRVLILFSDTGEGVENPELLFRPFQHNAKASGLGLYLSRALMRSFGGDLRCAPTGVGALFIVELAATVNDAPREYGSHHQATAH